MANIHSKHVLGNLVFYDTNGQRWIDAVGGGVSKFLFNTAFMAADDTTGYLSGFTHTAVEAGAGTSTAVLSDNTLLVTTAANEDDGVSLQVIGEAFKLDAATKRVYFGINFQASEATQSDFLVGLAITDTALLGGVTDAVYFECVDGSTDINFVLEKNSTETTSAAPVGTFADATDITLEFIFDGTSVDAWVNGTRQTRLAVTNLPDDENLTPSVEFLTGAASAETMTINWMRAIQIDGTK